MEVGRLFERGLGLVLLDDVFGVGRSVEQRPDVFTWVPGSVRSGGDDLASAFAGHKQGFRPAWAGNCSDRGRNRAATVRCEALF